MRITNHQFNFHKNGFNLRTDFTSNTDNIDFRYYLKEFIKQLHWRTILKPFLSEERTCSFRQLADYVQCTACACCPNSKVTSLPMSTNGAQYFRAEYSFFSRRDFIAWWRAKLALFLSAKC